MTKPKPKMFTEAQYNRLKKDRDGWKECYNVASERESRLDELVGSMYSEQQYQDLLNRIRPLEEKANDMLDKLVALERERNEARRGVERLTQQSSLLEDELGDLKANYNYLLTAFQNTAKLLEKK